MANKFQIKRTTQTGRTPNTTNSSNTGYIDAGELAINLTDNKLFSSNGTVYFEIGSNLSNLSVSSNLSVNTLIANGTSGMANQFLTSNGTVAYWTDLSTSIDLNEEYVWTNNHTFEEYVTFGNSSVNTVINSTAIITQSLDLSGNLTIDGGLIVVNSAMFLVGDAIVTLNSDLDGLNAPSDNAGIEVNRGSANDVAIIWNESTDKWTLTEDGVTYANIAVYSEYSTFASNADNISSGTLNTARLPSTINVATVSLTTELNVNNFVIANTTALKIGNTTVNTANIVLAAPLWVNGTANITSTLAAGNSTVTGFINVTSSAQIGGDIVTSGAVNAASINVGGNVQLHQDFLSIGNTSVNSYINATHVVVTNLSGNGSTITSVDSATIGGNTVLDIRSYSSNADNISSGTLDTARLPSTVNVASVLNVGSGILANTTVIRVGNTTVNTLINSTSVSTNNFFGNGASITSVDAATLNGNTATTILTYIDDKSGNAYSNATTYAANADNISSGTLNTARLPATVNVSTAVNVGANINLTTSSISVGNSTVNSSINSTSISISTGSFSGNGSGLSSVNAATVGANSASDLRNYSDTAAGTAYTNAIAIAIDNAIALSIALG